MMRKLSPLKHGVAKLCNAIAVATALCAAPASQASVLNFDTPVDYPIVFAGDMLNLGKYVIRGAGTGGMVGLLAEGDSCLAVQCPANGSGGYYTALADGYFFLSMADGAGFTISSLAASFLGAGEPSYPAISALLYITGYSAAGIVEEAYLPLLGPTGGNFNFATYDLTGFGGTTLFTEVRFASYACDAAGACNRNTNQANFAIDDIVTVPEPGTFALLGLGLAGLCAFTRRRAA